MKETMEKQLCAILEKLTEIDNETELFKQTRIELSDIFPGLEINYYKVIHKRNNDNPEKHHRSNELLVLIQDYFNKTAEPDPVSDYPRLEAAYNANKMIIQDFGDSNQFCVIPLKHEKEIQLLLEVLMPFPATIDTESLIHFLNILIHYYKVIRSTERDFLTGMYNRRAFNRVMNTLVRNQDSEISGKDDYLLIADIDFFKSINDKFGHMIGDEVLILFSRVIRSNIRAQDTVFRTGGEEFVILARNLAFKDMLNASERIRSIIEKTTFPQVTRVTISSGFTKLSYPLDIFFALKKADAALYYAKEHGRNQVCCYETLVEENKVKQVQRIEEVMDIW